MIVEFFKKLFPKVFKQIENENQNIGYERKAEETANNYRVTQEFVYKQYVGQPVVFFQNEIDDPVVGFALRVEHMTLAKQPTLIVKNYVDNQEVFFFGEPFIYDPVFFEEMMKMDRSCLLAIIYRNAHAIEKFRKDTETASKIMDYDEIYSKLKANGFIGEYELYKGVKDQYKDYN